MKSTFFKPICDSGDLIGTHHLDLTLASLQECNCSALTKRVWDDFKIKTQVQALLKKQVDTSYLRSLLPLSFKVRHLILDAAESSIMSKNEKARLFDVNKGLMQQLVRHVAGGAELSKFLSLMKKALQHKDEKAQRQAADALKALTWGHREMQLARC